VLDKNDREGFSPQAAQYLVSVHRYQELSMPTVPPRYPSESGSSLSVPNKKKLALTSVAVGVIVALGCNRSNGAARSPAPIESTPNNSTAGGNGLDLTPVSSVAAGETGLLSDASLAGTGSMQRVSLADPAVGMQDAMSVTIPSGWSFQGRIVRDVSCSPGDAFPHMQIASPDGAYSLTVMTPFFTTSMPTTLNLRGCGAVAQLMSSANILTRYVVPGLSKGGQASAPSVPPDAANFIQSVNVTNGRLISSGDAARVHLSLTQNGNAMEEYIEGHTVTSRIQGVPGGTTATTVFVYKAPVGQLDAFYQRATTAMALMPNPQWQQRNQQLQQQATMRAQQQGEQQRAAILQQGQDSGAAGRAMLARTQAQIKATGQASMNAAEASEAARHSGAVGTANLVGDRPTSTYFFCNSSGGRTTNNNPNSPGPGWYACR
jgi:hypothetical protein